MTLEESIRAAVADAVAPLVDEVRALRDLIARPAVDADEHGGITDLARWLGCGGAAAKSTVHRHPSLAALAARVGTRRVWSRRDVMAWLDARRSRPAPRLRAVGGAS